MKIKIKSNHHFPLTFHLPLFVLKWKWLNRLAIKKGVGIDLKAVYQEIKKAKRRHGSFVLVEANSHDGDKVKIIV